jgi:hypothetical protein
MSTTDMFHYCPECKRDVPAQSISLNNFLALCPDCGSVIELHDMTDQRTRLNNLSETFNQWMLAETITSPDNLRKIARPESIQVEALGNQVAFRCRWSWNSYWLGLVPAMAWGAFAVYQSGARLQAEQPEQSLALLAMAAPAIYAVTAYNANTTDVLVSRSHLTIKAGPLPWWGNVSVPMGDVQQFLAEQSGSDDDEADVLRPDSRVSARMVDGSKVLLMEHLNHLEARFIAQELEKALYFDLDTVELTPVVPTVITQWLQARRNVT